METILVVDDDDLVLRVVVKILRVGKFKVLSADSGQNALQIADTFGDNIDLLLSDVEMPQMSGPDLARTLQNSRPGIHVALMSGLGGDRLPAFDYGWAFIPKPFTAKQLVEMITELLHKPQMSQGSQG